MPGSSFSREGCSTQNLSLFVFNSKPVLCCRGRWRRAAVIRIYRPGMVHSKIIFAVNCSWWSIKIATFVLAFKTVYEPSFIRFHSCVSGAIRTVNSADVNILEQFAILIPVSKYIMTCPKNGACVVRVPQAICWKVACYSQMCWVLKKRLHSCQWKPIRVPILIVVIVIHGKIGAKPFVLKCRLIGNGERLYQRPYKARFWLQVTVNRKRFIGWVEYIVVSCCWGAVLSNVFAASWISNLTYLTTPLTSVYLRTSTVKPGAVSVTNFLTYPSVEAGI